MRYLIAIPCMDMVHTYFFASMLALNKPENVEVSVCSSSLIYDARNSLAMQAVNNGFDRVMWFDSDMRFGPDIMMRLIQDMDEGRDFVSALYFTRKKPIHPCVYKSLITLPDGKTHSEFYADYPKDQIFEAAGCGMGACMVSADALRAAGKNQNPFSPINGWGEDFSFELRLRDAGVKIWCDSRIVAAHVSLQLIDESTWEAARRI